jgi:L-ascorbate metabolism protein UlaG (beta-lactamase superfamily)
LSRPEAHPSIARTGDRYVDLDAGVRVGGDFWRWQRERRTARLPRAPAQGYAAFERAWRTEPDFGAGGSATGAPMIWWLGHATVLLRVGGLHVITDPHLGRRASPLPFLGPRRRVRAPARVPDLPRIDVVLVSHNHYDHLDASTIRALRRANPALTCYAPLGLAEWLRRRGVVNAQELGWWDRREHAGIEIACVPAQHWSARTLFDRNTTLWCGWVLRTGTFTFYFAGDTGYTERLVEVGERFGPPDLAALPIGAYLPRWFMRGQHVDPAEAVRLHEALQVKRSLAVHWGTFELADDSLDQPVRDLSRALGERGVSEDAFWVLRQGERRSL